MRRIMLLCVLVPAVFVAACQPSQPAAPPQAPGPFTIREIMKSMVAPKADVLWNAVAISVTEKGVETSAPSNEDEWNKIRDDAVTLAEAMTSIQMPGRKVANPGDTAKDPTVELNPDQIEELINKDRATWDKLARDAQEAVMAAHKAIEAKNVDGLSEAGGGIDSACEACHKMYWYPNDKGAQGQNPEQK